MGRVKKYVLLHSRHWLGIIGVLVILLSSVAQAATAIQSVSAATEITNVTGNKKTDPTRDDGLPVDPTTFYSGATYPVTYRWTVSSKIQVQAGDFITFTAPDGALFSGDKNIAVTDNKGNQIGTFSSVKGASTGIITFNDFFSRNPDMLTTGQLHVTLTGTADREISDAVPIFKKYNPDTSSIDENDRYHRAGWIVSINNFKDVLNNVVVTDVYASEAQAPVNKDEVYVRYANSQTDVPTNMYTLEWQPTGGFIFTYHGLLNQQVDIYYHSDITDPGYLNYGFSMTLTNTATIAGTSLNEHPDNWGYMTTDLSRMPQYSNVHPDFGAGGSSENVPSIDVQVTKQWTGVPTGVQTPPVTAELYKDGVATGQTLTLNADNKYTDTFPDLPTTDGNDHVYTYTVQEQSVPTGYITTTPGQQSLINKAVTLKNTYNTPQTIHVQKKWTGVPSGVTTPDVTATLYRNGTATDQTVKLTAANKYTADFTNLPTYADNGDKYAYTVSEDTTPAGYTNSTPGQQTPDNTSTVTLTNKFVPQTGTINVVKQWLGVPDADKDNLPDVTAVLYQNGQKTNTTVTLTKANDFTAAFKDLPGTDDNGQPIAYTVGEESVPAGFSQITKDPVTPDDKGQATLINQYIPLTTIGVKKTWQGVPDGVTTPDVTAKLFADGKDTGKTVALTAANKYQNTFTDLPTQNQDSSPIVYSVQEASVPDGYTTTQKDPIGVSDGDTGELINQYVPKTRDITVTKSWENVPTDVKTPDVTAVLYQNGKATNQTVTLTNENKYEASFTDLPTTDADGKAITYTVSEDDTPADYTSVTPGPQTPDADGTVSLVNRYNKETPPVTPTTTINVQKNWEDVPGAVATPEVIATLYANGQKTTQTVTLNQSNNYKASFTNLPQTDSTGKAIVYTVSEDATPAGYTNVTPGPQTPDKDGLVTLTNRYIVNPPVIPTTSITVHKQWLGVPAAMKDNLPPVIAVLYANGQKTGITLTLNRDNDYTDIFKNLPLTDSLGQPITYTVGEEEMPAGYTALTTQPIAPDAQGQVTLINRYIPQTRTITVQKVWQNVPNDVITPSVIATLYANGQKTGQTVTLTAANGYKADFTGLPTTDANGQAIVYTVSEDNVPANYTNLTAGQQTPGQNGSVTLINRYTGETKPTDPTKPTEPTKPEKPGTGGETIPSKPGTVPSQPTDKQPQTTGQSNQRLPQTGELQTRWLVWLGIALIGADWLLTVRRKKSAGEK
ncbi:Cna B-type domain-containing protein [Schleiferilactobacillus perolens]|uniref:Cna B-type domain-containing protein n=1 Tax=Schleiferilactobacillus perolens TaxID=100468 RepID=UPI0007095D22|nr:Cna B-type domain-containing protein [Schleiferilactobacillus perolens]